MHWLKKALTKEELALLKSYAFRERERRAVLL